MKLEFTEKLKKDNIYISDINHLFGTKEVDYDLQDLYADINYSISLDTRSWGVNGISLNIDKINFGCCITVQKEFLTDDEIRLLKEEGFKEYQDDLTLFYLKLEDVEKKSKIEIDVDSIVSINQIAISSIELDISKEKDIVFKTYIK